MSMIIIENDKPIDDSNPTKTYIGDSVYAQMEYGCQVRLTTENGETISNTIVLEYETLKRLFGFLQANFTITPK